MCFSLSSFTLPTPSSPPSWLQWAPLLCSSSCTTKSPSSKSSWLSRKGRPSIYKALATTPQAPEAPRRSQWPPAERPFLRSVKWHASSHTLWSAVCSSAPLCPVPSLPRGSAASVSSPLCSQAGICSETWIASSSSCGPVPFRRCWSLEALSIVCREFFSFFGSECCRVTSQICIDRVSVICPLRCGTF